jgi:inhibitor of cysteine peptidase
MSLLECGVFNQADSVMGSKKMSEVTLTEADNGKSIAVSLHEKVILRLNETPSTGFRWAVAMGDNEIIKLSGSDYNQTSGSAVGGSGHRVFVFEVKRSGSAHLLLKLRREWEGDKSIASRFEVTINVTN